MGGDLTSDAVLERRDDLAARRVVLRVGGEAEEDVELEYEGELVGGTAIAQELIRRAADQTLAARAGAVDADDVVMWFDRGNALQVTDDVSAAAMLEGFESVPGLMPIARRVASGVDQDAAVRAAACELVLEALVARRKISRSETGQYGRAAPPERRRPNQDLFGGGMMA